MVTNQRKYSISIRRQLIIIQLIQITPLTLTTLIEKMKTGIPYNFLLFDKNS